MESSILQTLPAFNSAEGTFLLQFSSCSSLSSVMGSYCCLSLLFSATIVVFVAYPILADGKEQITGPAVNVTKHLFFSDFRLDDPKTLNEVKLLGSARFSDEKGAIQIPDESQLSDLRHQAGRAVFAYPIRMLDPLTGAPASFETTFSFQFSNSSAESHVNSAGSFSNSGGSGLTFIMVPDEFTVGRPGPWLGMLNDACEDDYKAVAVEFDTRHNPEFGDPNDNHVGINLGSIISTTTVNASDAGVYLKDGLIHEATIVYDGSRRWMGISLGSKTIFSGSLDLSPFLNEYMFVGFSASTGNMTQIHNIYRWNFTSTSQASLRAPSAETCESKIMEQIDQGVQSSASSSSKKEPPRSLLIFISVMALAIAVFAGLFYNGRRRKNQTKAAVILPDKRQRPRPPNKPRRFTISEVSSATRGFHEYEMLGNDSKGVYYRGKLPNGCQVAIKRFSAQFLSPQLGLDRRRLLKEISTISRVRHPNLVPLRGWCQDNRETMVVYDFYPNGSLDKWLFGAGVLPWTRRLKVVRDVADALSFLHSKQLAHKNMKTTSVFLDVSFRAVLGDFGFVLSSTESQRFEATVSQKADVFEFGIFVLEVVSGRGRSESEASQEERDLLDFSWRMHETDEKARLVDRRMGSMVSLEQAIRVSEIGLLCTLNENRGRPCMEEVVEFLNLDRPIPELPPNRPVALFPYSSTNTGLCTGYSCTPFK
ncbi:L-TYPE LECTIN-DOMAIN CONTAINING RECEPTOR KINASE VIII.2-LIKE [Salix koriyanagi]|uniref:non-specific serine/threonine protein kinase n=1 Tax=Salix koriyanagi TaxID=2511006 RepID=A0A9Q0SRI5_9ROSI|nr:L-TYPE LECTIN-DOMAIN CONTAINING RECEPTOR KINASE VIII.2-LIKE [Salix koriyanagi]